MRVSLTDVDSAKDNNVVIEDLMSNMDSSALFLVTALASEMLAICNNNVRLENSEFERKYIKKNLLTNIAFFHREIIYNMLRQYRYVTVFKINKKNNILSVDACVIEAKPISDKDKNYNPVQIFHSALWEEYDKLDALIPLMSVIRRILEYYFLQLCGYDSEKLCGIVLVKNKDKFMVPVEASFLDYNKYNQAKPMFKCIQHNAPYKEGLCFGDGSINED